MMKEPQMITVNSERIIYEPKTLNQAKSRFLLTAYIMCRLTQLHIKMKIGCNITSEVFNG